MPVGNARPLRHVVDSRGNANPKLGGMGRKLTAAAVAFLTIALAGCDGSAAGSCSTAQDAAHKVTVLTDDLKTAQGAGKIETMKAGEIGAQIMGAGTKFGSGKDHRSYCNALDRIRKDAGL